jgi:hypothetical protein
MFTKMVWGMGDIENVKCYKIKKGRVSNICEVK